MSRCPIGKVASSCLLCLKITFSKKYPCHLCHCGAWATLLYATPVCPQGVSPEQEERVVNQYGTGPMSLCPGPAPAVICTCCTVSRGAEAAGNSRQDQAMAKQPSIEGQQAAEAATSSCIEMLQS